MSVLIGSLLAAALYGGVAAWKNTNELRPKSVNDSLAFWLSILVYTLVVQLWKYELTSLAVVAAAVIYSALTTMNDVRDWRIPDSLNILSFLSFLALTIPYAVSADNGSQRLVDALITSAIFAVVFTLIVILSGGRLGGGDIRLGALLAFPLGWVIQPNIVAAFVLLFTVLIGASLIKLLYAFIVYRIRLKHPTFLEDPEPPPIEGLNESFAKTTVPAGPSFSLAVLILLSLT